ncbi:arginine--tRNA ligase, partial [Streptococcus agalactiae]
MDTKHLIASEIQKVVPDMEQSTILSLLETPKNSSMGDLAFPAFSLAKTLRKAPQIIASDIAEQIKSDQFEKVEAVGPYVNFFLDKAAISSQVLKQVLSDGSAYATQNIGEGRNVAIDMSSPNIAKPFSIGHLRSTVIGDSLANIFDKIGYHPVKINHLGDWGKQFGMLIVAYKKWGNEEAVRAHPIDELLKLYVRINAEAETDPSV